MKRLLLCALILAISELAAQETMGAAAADSTEAAQSSNWQNWVFASSALVTAVAGVVIISLNSGTTSH